MTINEIEKEYNQKPVNHQSISLVFDCYEFYKFIEMIEKYCEEIEFVFENSQLTIIFYDSNRIMCCRCIKELDKLTTIEKMKFPIDIKTFRDVLKTRKDDKKELELIFDNTKKHLEVIKTSDKYNSTKKGTFNLLDTTIDELDLQRLLDVNYDAKASFLIKYLNDFFYESGKYSGVINISIDTNGIVFNEEGIIGTSDYIIKAKYCNILDGFAHGAYSLEFLEHLKQLLPILDITKYVSMKILNDNPIRLDLNINSLDMDLTIFIAPRVTYKCYEEEEEY